MMNFLQLLEFHGVSRFLNLLLCPIVEMPTRSKLSCLSWNKNTKNHIASSDYEGIFTVWDVNTCQVILIFVNLSISHITNSTLNFHSWSMRNMRNEHHVPNLQYC
ncbi:putative transcription factor WD40-like family [Helianthus anomalus]